MCYILNSLLKQDKCAAVKTQRLESVFSSLKKKLFIRQHNLEDRK